MWGFLLNENKDPASESNLNTKCHIGLLAQEVMHFKLLDAASVIYLELHMSHDSHDGWMGKEKSAAYRNFICTNHPAEKCKRCQNGQMDGRMHR